MQLPERFWNKVLVNHATGCWIWTACQNREGYGRFRVGGRSGKTWYAHRFAYEAVRGPIPEGLQLDHLCRVHECVNPAHLEPVTIQENLLRGEGLTAVNAGRTHCPRGHAYEESNTYITKRGERVCRQCRREKARARREGVPA